MKTRADAWQCEYVDCGHVWISREGQAAPDRCAGCRRAGWNKSEFSGEFSSVYLMYDGKTGLHKIGISFQPESRRIALGNKVSIMWTIAHAKARQIEGAFHNHFADKRDRGEWFRLEDSDIQWVKSAKLFHPKIGEHVSMEITCKCHKTKSHQFMGPYTLIPI